MNLIHSWRPFITQNVRKPILCVLSESYTATDALPPILPACRQPLLPACMFITWDTIHHPRLFFPEYLFVMRGVREPRFHCMHIAMSIVSGRMHSAFHIKSHPYQSSYSTFPYSRNGWSIVDIGSWKRKSQHTWQPLLVPTANQLWCGSTQNDVITPVIATPSETAGHINMIHIPIKDLEYTALRFIMRNWKIWAWGGIVVKVLHY
jgi:hypothetical protein